MKSNLLWQERTGRFSLLTLKTHAIRPQHHVKGRKVIQNQLCQRVVGRIYDFPDCPVYPSGAHGNTPVRRASESDVSNMTAQELYGFTIHA